MTEERKVNVKTNTKTGQKTAHLTGSFISRSYQTLACTKEFAESVCKNSPRRCVYCSLESKPQGEF